MKLFGPQRRTSIQAPSTRIYPGTTPGWQQKKTNANVVTTSPYVPNGSNFFFHLIPDLVPNVQGGLGQLYSLSPDLVPAITVTLNDNELFSPDLVPSVSAGVVVT